MSCSLVAFVGLLVSGAAAVTAVMVITNYGEVV